MGFKPEGEINLPDFPYNRPLRGEKKVLGQLLRDGAAALDNSFGTGVCDDCARRADDIDAEMIKKAPILGGQGRLDERVRDFLERHGIGELNASFADLIAIAVEERDAKIASSPPVRVLCEVDGRNFEQKNNGQAAGAKRCRFGKQLHEDAPDARDPEARKEIVVVCPRVFKSRVEAIKS